MATLNLLRLAIEENGGLIDNIQDDINDINTEIDGIQDQIDGLDALYVNVTGDTMTGALSMSDNFVRQVKNPVLAKDAVNLEYLQARIDELPTGNLETPPYFRHTIVVESVGTDFPFDVSRITVGKEYVFLNGTYLSRQDYGITETGIELSQPAYVDDVIENHLHKFPY